MVKAVSEILNAAADLIEPEGAWHQGWYASQKRGHRCWCVLGAIKEVGKYESDANPAAKALRSVVDETWIHEWNDAPDRTQAEVVAKLREAAALALQEGK